MEIRLNINNLDDKALYYDLLAARQEQGTIDLLGTRYIIRDINHNVSGIVNAVTCQLTKAKIYVEKIESEVECVEVAESDENKGDLFLRSDGDINITVNVEGIADEGMLVKNIAEKFRELI